MATVRVSNVSDRPNTAGQPVAIMIGRQTLRPGKTMLVDDSVLNERHRAMHGSRLWIGELPVELRRTSRAALNADQPASTETPPLTLAQARLYLGGLDTSELHALALSTTPPVDVSSALSQLALVSRLSRALFQAGRELDPEMFFWLGRWTYTGGAYSPKE